jgi:hypothetical protein
MGLGHHHHTMPKLGICGHHCAGIYQGGEDGIRYLHPQAVGHRLALEVVADSHQEMAGALTFTHVMNISFRTEDWQTMDLVSSGLEGINQADSPEATMTV